LGRETEREIDADVSRGLDKVEWESDEVKAFFVKSDGEIWTLLC
jgi:hypothetical protein